MSTSLAELPGVDENLHDEAILYLEDYTLAAAALKAGKLPSSDQLANIFKKLLASDFLSPDLGSRFAGRVGGGKLSGPGRELVQQARNVIESLLKVGLEKNGDDKIQRFIYAASKASLDVDANLEKPEVPLPSSAELADARESLRGLMTSFISSDELRSLIIEGVQLGRDLFADAAESVAEGSIRATRASKKAAKEARLSEEERAQGKTGLEGKDFEDAKELKKRAIRAAEDVRDDVERAANRKLKEVKHYVDEQLPTDARDAVIERFKAIVNDIQSQPEYKDSIDTLFGLVQKYASLATDEIKEAAAQSSAVVESNEAADSAAKLFREIVESFTGPLDDVFSTLDVVIKDLEGDERIRSLVNDSAALLDRAVHDPGYATSSRAQRKAEELYDRAQELVKSNASWKKDADALVDEISKAGERAANDRSLIQLGRSLERFGLASRKFARRGLSLASGRDFYADITQVFLPRLVNTIRMLPLPRVEYTSAEFDLALDNIRFTAASFLPDATYLTNHNEVSVKRGYAAYASNFETSTTLSFAGLRFQAKDLSYYVNKKQGWITIEDSGLLDIFIGSESPDVTDGLDITFTIENAGEDDHENFFVLKKVDVAVEGFDIRVHGSRHPISSWLASGSIRKYMEAQFITAMEEQAGHVFKQLDTELFKLQHRAAGAYGAAPDPAAYLRALFVPSLSGSSGVTVKDTGITKVGPNGEYILAIGVEEELLPGKLTGLGLKGEDIASRKRQVESYLDDGRSDAERAQRRLDFIGAEVGDKADQLALEFDQREADERRTEGWRSDAFNL